MTYQSRLLNELNALLGKSLSLDERIRILCRKVIYMARLNRLSEARHLVKDIRTDVGNDIRAAPTIWIQIAEGVIFYYDFELDKAFDRFQRARALSVAISKNELKAAASIWLSKISTERGQFIEAIDFFSEALESFSLSDLFTYSNVLQVGAALYSDANLNQIAMAWFKEARRPISAEGDESALGALLYNVNVNRINEIRLSSARGKEAGVELEQIAAEIDSSVSFDGLLNGIGLPENAQIIKGHTLTIKGQWSAALAIFDSIDINNIYHHNRASLHADKAYCFSKINLADAAKLEIESAVNDTEMIISDDERSFVYGRLSQAFEVIGDAASAEIYAVLSSTNEARYRELQKEIANRLSKINSTPPK